MESRRRNLQAVHFRASLELLVEWRNEREPTIADMSEHMQTIIADGSALAEWHAAAIVELDPKVARYASAIKRITGKPSSFYHAFQYKDMAVLADLWHRIPWMRDWQMEEILQDDDARKQIWDVLLQMSEFARGYHEIEIVAPSRTEISANIQAHRASRHPQKPAMGRGFDAMFEELMISAGIPKFKPASNVERVKLWMEQTAQHDVDQIIRDKNIQQLKSIPFKHDEFARVFAELSDDVDEAFWTKLSTMHSFAGVQNGIPNNMMSKIESTAQRLAGDIATGRTDMSALNIADLGRSVLEDCDPTDMEAFSANMGQILPMLTSLQSSMAKGGPGGFPMPLSGASAPEA